MDVTGPGVDDTDVSLTGSDCGSGCACGCCCDREERICSAVRCRLEDEPESEEEWDTPKEGLCSRFWDVVIGRRLRH